MNAMEIFAILALLSAHEHLLPGNGRIDTLAQWGTADITVQAHRSLERNADGTYRDPIYTIEFVSPGAAHVEMPDTGGPELLAAFPQLLAAIDAQRALDGVVRPHQTRELHRDENAVREAAETRESL